MSERTAHAMTSAPTETIQVGAFSVHFLVEAPGVMTPDYFREIHEVLAPTRGGPPDPAKVSEVMRRHGLTPARPAG
jgi:hypothetical protein